MEKQHICTHLSIELKIEKDICQPITQRLVLRAVHPCTCNLKTGLRKHQAFLNRQRPESHHLEPGSSGTALIFAIGYFPLPALVSLQSAFGNALFMASQACSLRL